MIILLLGLLGIVFGSFVNASVWRLHEQAALEGKTGGSVSQKRRALSITRGRSMCETCGHELAVKDLVPLLSWLSLNGRCRYCRVSISVQNPIAELLMAVLFMISYAAWPLTFHGVGLFQFVFWLVFVMSFVGLALYDLQWFLLPDRVVLPVTLLAALQTVVVTLWRGSVAQLWQPVLAAVLIFGLFWLLFQASKGAWIGGGDVKLAAALGLLAATPLRAFLVIFLASLFGTLVSLPLLTRTGKRGLKTHIPFGPYLLLATFVVVLYGSSITNWYQNLLVG